MFRLQVSFCALLLLAPLCTAYSPRFLPCQVQKPASQSPLTGCPSNTIFVSSNTSDPHASFHSIQAAINSLSSGLSAVILVAQGEYQEILNITRAAPLTLLGQVPASSKVDTTTTSKIQSQSPNLNLVQVWGNKFVQTGMDDATSVVLTVAPNGAAALIGAGPTGAPLQPDFGNVDFKAYNIDFQNRAAKFAISQALATDISYANASFYGCSFASFQDTWYTGRNGSTYVVDSVIYGQTDYLFGFGTAWFEKVILANRACGGGIVAWKGTNLTDAPDNRYGAYIADSKIMRSPDANATTVTTGKCFLGRPWNDLATTVFLRTNMDQSIQPAGWTLFSNPVFVNTTFYAENDSTGAGGNSSQRVPIDRILTDADVARLDLTIPGVFSGTPAWIDTSYVA